MPSVLKFLADTNVVSAWMAGDKAILQWESQHRNEIALSTISLAEIRRGIELLSESKNRRELEKRLQFLLEDFEGAIWVFDEASAWEWGRLMAESRRHNHPLPFGDSLIGAMARAMNAKVLSADKAGFPGCDRVDPWTDTEYLSW